MQAALAIYSRNHPDLLVRPELFSCFVHQHKSKDEDYYFPVVKLNTRDSASGPILEVNIDLLSFCRNPNNIKTEVTGNTFIGHNYSECRYLYCPQLDCDLAYDYSLLSNGVMVFGLW